MKMNCKRFIGLLGIILAFGLVFVACNDDNGNGNGNVISNGDPGYVNGIDNGIDNGKITVNPIEAAFTNMLKANFIVSGSDVTVVNTITKMNNWSQTNSEYAITGTKGKIKYFLPSSFGTVQVMSDGDAIIISGGAVLMTGPDASIVWGTLIGDADLISGSSGSYWFYASGSDVKTVSYPYTVTYPSVSDDQIKGKLNLNLNNP